jgi:uncharacterized membrane protein YphA (DoxX/SURF4 family)
VNIFFWVLQVFLALHTLMGAVWKLSHSEQSVASLKAIPHGVWLAMMVFEVVCSVALIVPAAAPFAAAGIAAEMLLMCVVHVASGYDKHGQMMYWLVVAAVSSFLAYGRFVLKP